MIGTLLTFLGVAIVSIIAIWIVLSVLGALVGVAAFLLFKVAPVLFIGWVVLKLLGKARDSGGGTLSAADRKWLERQ